jgi:hemin uptake protein HemP
MALSTEIRSTVRTDSRSHVRPFGAASARLTIRAAFRMDSNSFVRPYGRIAVRHCGRKAMRVDSFARRLQCMSLF